MNLPLRVLIVEDSEDDATLLVRELRRGGYDVASERVDTVAAMSAALDAGTWDVILSDYSMPQFSAHAALKLLQERGPDIPFIIVSGTIGEDAAVQAMQAGAQDYFSKDKLARLVPAMERALRDAEERRQRRRAEVALRESEQRFSTAFRASPIGISISGADSRILDVNDYALRLFGAARDEVIGKTSQELGIWDDSADRERVSKALEQHGFLHETEIRWRSHAGEIRDVLASFVLIELQGQKGVLSLFHDITTRKRAEAQLQYQAHLLASVNDAVFATDSQLILTAWNRAAEQMYGWKEAEVLGKPVNEVIVSDFEVGTRAEIETILVASGNLFVEVAQYDRFGKRIYVESNTIAIRDASGRITGFVAVNRDVTERKLAEEARRLLVERLRILHSIDQAILAAQSPEEIARAALGRIQPLLGARRASVTLFDFRAHEVVVLADFMGDMARATSGARVSMDASNVPDSIREGQEVVTGDIRAISNPSPLYEMLLAEGIYSYVQLPLMSRGGVLGALTLAADHAEAFSPQKLDIAREVASQLAVTLENARLRQMERKHSAHLEAVRQAGLHLTSRLELQSVLDAILDHALLLTGADDGHVFLYDGERLHFGTALWAGRRQDVPLAEPRPGGLTYTVARNGERLVVPDMTAHPLFAGGDWSGAIVGLPLRVGDQVRGVMSVGFVRPREMEDTELQVLELLADQAAVAIQNAQLYQQVRRHAEELEQRVAERTEQLVRAKDHVEAILNSSSDAIILLNATGIIQQVNPAFCRLFGYQSDEVFESNLSVLVEPSHSRIVSDTLASVIASDQPSRVEIKAQRGDGVVFDADAVFSMLSYGAANTVVCSIRDISERKQIEEGLRHSLEREKELGELKSRFISTVSHEYRTPLAAILSSSELLKDYGDRMTDERKTQHLDRIHIQISRMTDLLDDVLTVTRAQAGKLEFNPISLDLEALCRDVVEEFQLIAPSHRYDFRVAGVCGSAAMDPKLMRQAVTNLVSNAVKYSQDGATVQIDLTCNSDAFVLKISDQGIGIPEEDQKHLFEVFHRARNVGTVPGTGLGLVIVKQAVDRHGGAIAVESKDGAGTTFTITIPATDSR